MTVTSKFIAMLLLTFGCQQLMAADYPSRTWTGTNGKKVEAAFVAIQQHVVSLKTEKGVTRLNINQLSEADQEYLKNILRAQRAAELLLDPKYEERALKELAALGEAGNIERDRAFARWFAKSFTGPVSSRNASPPPLAECTAYLETQQKLRDMIPGLSKEDTKKAHELYDELDKSYEKIISFINQTRPIIEKLEELDRYVTMAKKHSPNTLKRGSETIESYRQSLNKQLGQPASGGKLKSSGSEPSDPIGKLTWNYARYRTVEEQNNKSDHGMSAGEKANADLVNHYRELLGIRPLVYSSNLVKAARGHSSEMEKLGYFSHTSPTKGRQSVGDRLALAGYVGRGYSENIFRGRDDASMAFWAWFHSPGHHQNMARTSMSELGVGLNGATWTQNFGVPR